MSEGATPADARGRREIPRGLRPVLVSLLLLLVLWPITHFTAFRTRLHLESSNGRLSLTINGRTIERPTRVPTVSGIEVELPDSAFPMVVERLTVRQGDRIVLDDRPPGRFAAKAKTRAPLGDWYVDDQYVTETVYRHELDLKGDLTVDATFRGRSMGYAAIVLRGQPQVLAQFRRGLINNDFVINAGGAIIVGDAVLPRLREVAWNAVDLLLRSLVTACVLVILFGGLAWLLSRSRSQAMERLETIAEPRWRRQGWTLAAAGIALVALGLCAWVAKGVLEGLPHTPDEVAYLVQAKWLVANRLFQSATQIAEHLPVPHTFVRDGKWFAMYPIGWPLLLAAGEAVGLPWIVAPICGAVYVLLVFLIGRELYGRMAGLAAAVLATLSPMAILMFASYLSHGAAAMTIALFLWLYLVARRRDRTILFGLSGAALGYAFAIRPLTAVAVACPFALVLIWELWKAPSRWRMLGRLSIFVVGGVIGSMPALISNLLITGDPLVFAYTYGANSQFSMDYLSTALINLDATLASVLPAIFGWGWSTLRGWPILSLSLAFAFVPFLLRRPRRFDLLLGAMFLVLPLSFLTWLYHGLHGYGPRFYFEGFLGLYLLTGFGFLLLGGVEESSQGAKLRWGRAVAVVAAALFLGLVISTAATLRSRMLLYPGYNDVGGALERAIESEGVHHALILFLNGDWFPWGQAGNLLETDLQAADVAFAAPSGDNSKLAAFYPGRAWYVWNGVNLTALGPDETPANPGPLQGVPAAVPATLTDLLLRWAAVALLLGAVAAVASRSRWARWLVRSQEVKGVIATKVAPEVVERRQVAVERRGPDSSLTLPRAALGTLALACAYLGQGILVPNFFTTWLPIQRLSAAQQFHAGWMLLVAAAILAAIAWRAIDLEVLRPVVSGRRSTAQDDGSLEAADASSAARVSDGTTSPERTAVRIARWVLIGAAVAIYAWNIWDWIKGGETTTTRWLWAASIVLLPLSQLRFRLRPIASLRRSGDLDWWVATLVACAIVGLAFYLRFVRLEVLPLDVHGDSVSAGLSARQLLAGEVKEFFWTGWASMPWLAFTAPALSMKIFGDDLFGLSMNAVLLGTAAVAGIYLLGSLLFDRRIGLLAAAISAIGYFEIHFSRIPSYIDPVAWGVFGMYLFMRGIYFGRLSSFIWAGIVLGFGFETYYSGRLAGFVIVGCLLHLLLFDRRLLRERLVGIVLFVVSGIVVTGPMLPFFIHYREALMARTNEVYLFATANMAHSLGKYSAANEAQVVIEQLWRALLTFNYTGDSSTQFGFRHPLLNPRLAPLLVLGVGFCLSRLSRLSRFMVTMWLLVGLVLGLVLTIDSPFWPRIVVLSPAITIVTALGLALALASLWRLATRGAPRFELQLAAAMLFVLWVGRQNWDWYANSTMATWAEHRPWLGRLINETPPGTGFCMVQGPVDFGDRVLLFFGKGYDLLQFPQDRAYLYLDKCVSEGRIFVLYLPDHQQVSSALDSKWPGGRREVHDHPDGIRGPTFWYPPAGAASATAPES